uniref:Uncharacterized protein n=1 Tax=Craspedostauros australis TaxID=1486917 RepID=A0A7R9ZKK1_9STRA|mmetsp:Transcript_16260/g.45075  ORF Transcript_16260/g.45075 Transcript_16260/m.45075 type:complete len:185 (+) Transcript_16260:348-902(+)
MTGAGYGICLDGEAAKQADKSDWVQCGADIDAAIVATSAKEFAVKNPYDVTCVAATAEGDSETCKQTVDEDGQPCEWCSLQAHEFCLSDEQAQIFEQLGATCDDDATPSILSVVKDIQDITCIAQSTEDEVTCESTIDEDGNACEFCTISDYNLCLTGDQATLAEQLGVSCGDDKRKQPVLESS